MDDDFDNGLGMPDEELPGGSALSDTGDIGAEHEGDAAELNKSSGRTSGGARAGKSSGAGKSGATPAAAKRGSGGSAKRAAKKGAAK
jgi:hypothetical protein